MAKRTNKGHPDPKDWHLWSEVTRSIEPIPQKAIKFPSVAETKVGPTQVKQKKTNPSDNDGRFYSPPWSPGADFVGTKKGFGAPAIEPRINRRVRRGQVPIDATIDLHGMRQDEARSALFHFVTTRVNRGNRTLLVITGKGLKKTGYGAIAERGVLRHMLPGWLNEPELKPFIAGWEVSARQHGGEGAFYVRLKRVKP